MNYLKSYNINEDQIKEIEKNIKDNNLNIDVFLFDQEKIIAILNLFLSIGVKNFYDIFMMNPSMFFDTIDSIKLRIESYPDREELGRLLNEDAANLFLVDLL